MGDVLFDVYILYVENKIMNVGRAISAVLLFTDSTTRRTRRVGYPGLKANVYVVKI